VYIDYLTRSTLPPYGKILSRLFWIKSYLGVDADKNLTRPGRDEDRPFPVPIFDRNFVRNCADTILEHVSIDCFGKNFDRHSDRHYFGKSADRILEHVSIGISIETVPISVQTGFRTMFR